LARLSGGQAPPLEFTSSAALRQRSLRILTAALPSPTGCRRWPSASGCSALPPASAPRCWRGARSLGC
jgi:hypothetical protein